MKRKNTGLAMLLLAAVFMTAACSPTDVNSTTGNSGSTAAEGASSGGTHYDLTLGTAASTGTYYVVGAAIANEVNTKNPDLTVVAQTTNGGVENVNLCMSGEMDLGMTNADAAYWSSHGGGSGFYEIYAEPGNVKGVMRLYESQGHMITTANSGIETYEDLRGKTVCLGPPSSTIPAMSIAILEAYGINPVSVVEKYPYYTAAATKEGAYPNMNSVNTLKIYTEIIASGDVPEEAVYQFVKGALEGQPDYVDAHVACQEINAETAASAAAKLHPGAARYYRELGLID